MGPFLHGFAALLPGSPFCLHTGVSVSAASEANDEKRTKLLLQVIRLILVYVSMVAMLVQVVTSRIISTSYYLFFYLFLTSTLLFIVFQWGKRLMSLAQE